MSIYTPSRSDDAYFDKIKVLYFSNEFPKDDLQASFRKLYNNSKDRRHHILARFLEEATLAIRDELSQLSTNLRNLIPPFETILTIVDFTDLRKSQLCGAIDGILLCTLELGTLIGQVINLALYYEQDPTAFGTDNGKAVVLTGLGIGLLATAAVSLARTVADIVTTGAQVIRQAFRLGILVNEVSQNLQPRDLTNPGAPNTWAYVLPEVSADVVQHELDSIHEKEKTPKASRVFISALSATSVTVSGPPSRLQAMFRTAQFFHHHKFVALPVYGGLCHARHIYNEDDAIWVIQTPSMDSLNSRFSPRLPIYSTSSGEPFTATSAKELFKQIITEILTEKIQWDKVIQGIVQLVKDWSATQCQLLVFRLSLPVCGLSAALQKVPDLNTTTEEIMSWMHAQPTVHEDGGPRGPMQSKIAIVGMSCRMPGGATDTEKFWELLEQGLDVHRRIPADRFDVDSHWDPAGKRVNTSHTQYGCFIDEPGLFDAPFFNMSPRETEQTDPMQRLALVTAYEALERAGYVANRTAATDLRRIGTFYGQASDDYREVACTALWNGDVDTAVAGGMNVLTNSDAFAGLSHGHFLTKTPNACKTWDSEADGYCRADAVGSVVMKRLKDAEADNDNILGVILSAATNHSAEAISITHPHAGHQAYLGKLVANRAGVDPLDVDYVEMHGTGTQAGDTEEIQSVMNVFSPSTRRRSSKNPLFIGAVKSNVGHSEAAAGVTALIKILLMFQKNAIPPHVGIKNGLNPAFPNDLDRRQIRIPYQKTPWAPTPGKRRVAAVNNFSAAGGNSSLLIEEAPTREITGTDPRSAHVICISAKSKISLRGNIQRLLAYIEQNPDVPLASLAYSLTARRYHHNHRVSIAASSVPQIQKKLQSILDSIDFHKPIPATGPPSVAFAFTGQGAAYKSSSYELFHTCPYFRAQILHLDAISRGQGFSSFIPVIDGSHPREYEHSPVITQVAQESANGKTYEVACVNGPKETVLSGPTEEMDTIVHSLEEDGYKCFSLDVAFAFHSSQIDPVLDDFEHLAKSSVLFQEPHIPVLSPLLSKVIFDDRTVNANYVRRSAREAVNFKSALEAAYNIGTVDDETVWIEIGPHPVCLGFIKSTLSPKKDVIPSFRRGEDNWVTMSQSLASLHCTGVNIGWSEFHRPFEKVLELLDLPTYAWNDRTYWIQYNGDWALTKGNTFYDEEKVPNKIGRTRPVATSGLSTSTVHQIIEQRLDGTSGTIVMQSDVMQVDFRSAAWGHKMNDCGVVTSSIHADISYTLGEYLYRKLMPKAKQVHMSINNLEVTKGLVAHNNPESHQHIQVSVTTSDIASHMAELTWSNVLSDGISLEQFATATIVYGDPADWMTSWISTAHLIQGRIQDLERMADSGIANRFNHKMAYLLVAHLAGFVMNVSDAVDTKNNFCVTPGWGSMRFAKPLVPGGRYQSYVKMIPTEEDPSVYLGDVYILQNGAIMGKVDGIKFCRYPRILLSRFFSAPDDVNAPPTTIPSLAKTAHTKSHVPIPIKPIAIKIEAPMLVNQRPAVETSLSKSKSHPNVNGTTPHSNASASESDSETTTAKALKIISNESAIDIIDLTDDASFADLGVDSLMSLVIAEKFREQLGVVVGGSLFLEYPTIGHLRSWLEEYYS
ncbi:hypothetical protein ACSS6W_004252 [Trichoderma asperelloides]